MSRVEGDVLVVDADLMALARIRDSAARAGREVRTTTASNLRRAVEEGPVTTMVLDLDRGGVHLVDAVAGIEDAPPRVLAFFSHVNAELGRASEEAGFETYPRGRFWTVLEELLG